MHNVVRSRVLLAAAVGLGVAALAATAVMADAGGGGDTVGICQALGGGKYVFTRVPKTDFYGTLSEHGNHTDDIVPPFNIDNPALGQPSSFDGRNWDDAGQQILNHGCASEPPAPTPPDPSKKVRICHATSSHSNPYVSNEPAIANNGDLHGGHLDHKGPVYPEEGWGDIIPPYEYVDENGKLQQFPGYNWSPEGQAIHGNGCNPLTPPPEPSGGSITVNKQLLPNNDAGRFDLKIDREVAGTGAGVGDQGTTGVVPVSTGKHTVSEAGAGDTSLADYTIRIVCHGGAGGGKDVGSHDGPSVDVDVAEGAAVVCTITNTRKAEAKDVTPTLNCVAFDGDTPKFAVWGYSNGNDFPVVIPVGDANKFAPPPEKRTQPTIFEPGPVTGSFQTPFQSDENSLTWTLSGHSVTADASSSRCTPTVEVQKAVVPASDPGVFNLQINGNTLATGGDGATTGPHIVGVGEATVSETAEPGTSLADYDSSFSCARNGGADISGSGTHADVTVSAGDAVVCRFTNLRHGTPEPSPATLEVQKALSPASDPGRFDLQIDGITLATGGDKTTTGPISVGTGQHTVSETAAPGTNLADYDSSVICVRNGASEGSVPGTSLGVAVDANDVVVCEFTNVRHGSPEPPNPEPPTPTPPGPNPPKPEPPTPTPPGPNPPTPIPPPTPGPKPLLDLAVVKTGRPAAVLVGAKITWTMTVTNRSSVAAAEVNGLKVNDPRSFRTKLISLKTSQGTCRPYVCNLGHLAPGATAKVVAVTRAFEVGPVVDIVRVGSEEIESNYRNNIASALVRVLGTLRPPKAPTICRTLTAEPRVLQARRTSVVLLTARNRLGRPLVGFPIRILGSGVVARARTGRQGVARLTVAPTRAGLVLFAGGRHRVVHRPTCITVLAALRARATHVTG